MRMATTTRSTSIWPRTSRLVFASWASATGFIRTSTRVPEILKQAADDVLEDLGVDDPLLEIALNLEQVALKDEFFVKRRLYPNVDFYSGILYSAMGIPTKMFTVMFALGRLPGWIAQWKEMREDPKTRINRPRQIYTLAQRSASTVRSTSDRRLRCVQACLAGRAGAVQGDQISRCTRGRAAQYRRRRTRSSSDQR